MVVEWGKEIRSEYALKINKEKIKAQSSVNLLRVRSDSKLMFNNHISTIFQKAGNKCHNQNSKKYLGQKGNLVLFNNFVYSNFSYCRDLTNKVKQLHFGNKTAMYPSNLDI